MKAVLHVKGPSDAGPGERQEMLRRARALLDQAGVGEADVVRLDVPGQGREEPAEGSSLRPAVEPLVPALQSGSLFGGKQGVAVVDAQHLHAGEAKVVADLVATLDPEAVTVVFVTAGSLPAALAKAVKQHGEITAVKKMRERDAAEWLAGAARERRLRLHADAVAALVQRFGSDVAALEQALDQLVTIGEPITKQTVLDRFRNRPDEPMWHYVDAVAQGRDGEALRRLADFLTHGHPLQLLAFLERDLRWRSLAAVAPDQSTFAAWVGSSPEAFPVKKAWRQRNAAGDAELHRALGALTRADRILKTEPEDVHRLTMERLTVALCRWYGGTRRRAG